MDRRHLVLGIAIAATLADNNDRGSDSGTDWYEWASLAAEGPSILLEDDRLRDDVSVTVRATLPSAGSSARGWAEFAVTLDDGSLGPGVVSLSRVACASGEAISEPSTPFLVLGDFLDDCEARSCSRTFCVAVERNGYPYAVALQSSASAVIEAEYPLESEGSVSLTIEFDD